MASLASAFVDGHQQDLNIENQRADYAEGEGHLPVLSSVDVEADDVDPLSAGMLKKRRDLHDRICTAIQDKLMGTDGNQNGADSKKHTSLRNYRVLGKFFYIDVFWGEKLLQSFTDCDDWSYLMKSINSHKTNKLGRD